MPHTKEVREVQALYVRINYYSTWGERAHIPKAWGWSLPKALKNMRFATVVKAFISWYYKFIVSLLLVDCLRGLACSPTYK